MTNIFINDFCNKFDNIIKKPEKFISSPEKLINNIKKLIKETYDFTKKEETQPVQNTLPELIVDNFDVEQIWQQIELQNENILSDYLSSVSKLVAVKERLWFPHNDNEVSDEECENKDENNGSEINDKNESECSDNEESNNVSNDENSNDENESKDEQHITVESKKKKSIVDDEFFKLDEMENFLKKEEQKPDNHEESDDSDEEAVDLFANNLEEDDSEENSDSEFNPKYNEFFGESIPEENKKRKKIISEDDSDDGSDEMSENKKRKVRFEGEVQDDNDREEQDENKNIKSSLELREERLKQRIENIEESALEDKPWQLKGEVTADKRPQNSLLEEIVDFDMTVRPAPVITEETTMRLEDVIKQRIKDKVWDDVERKTKLIETPLEYKKKLLLDQEKSKQSLAQIYEDEYVKQQESLDPNASEKPEEEPKEHIEVKTMMKSLFSKLDALSNFHFTPKTVQPELRIVNNLPAINMEEVAPVATSDATLLAPEEIKNKSKRNEIGKTERTKTDKRRERRQKKQKQKEHAKAKIHKEKLLEKIKPGLGNKYSKQKTAKLLEKVTKDRNVDKMDESTGNKSLKSSTAFFTQLQDEVKEHIKSKTKTQNKKTKQIFTAKKLKL